MVDADGVYDTLCLQRLSHNVVQLFELKLWRMDSYDPQSMIFVLLSPELDEWLNLNTVVARDREEYDEDDLPS